MSLSERTDASTSPVEPAGTIARMAPGAAWKETLKRRVLPAPGWHRLPVGIGRGLRVELDFAHHTRLYLGLYEIELNRHLRRLCRPGTECFDVGGQYGYDALVMAKLTGTRVLSFECDAAQCDVLRANVAANAPYAALVDVCHAFVGSATDPATNHAALDDVAFGEGGFLPGMIKIDIEGGEVDALRGAERILRERRPHLLIETHAPDLDRQCRTILAAHGYEPATVTPRRWLPDHRPSAFNQWLVADGDTR